MTEQAKVPAIRFAGFTDPWEQRKLIMVAPLQRGFDLPAEKIIPGVYPVMMSNGIGAYHNEYKVKGPGVVTGRSGTIGNLQYVESAFWPHNTTLWVTKFYGNHPKFIYYLYEKIDLKRYKAGSGVPTLNRNDVHDTMVFFPASRKEQELISAVLTYLDDLITLHQRKYDKLVILKKSMLEKMFPKDGESVPEIRFAGFTDPWEQRKFVDFVEASGIRNKDNLQLESYSVSNDRGFVPQDEQFENGGTMRDADKTAYWIVEPGSFAYNPARINVGSIGYQSTRKNVIVSSLYEVFKTDRSCDDRFLWHWFKSSLFTKQIEMLQEGGVRLYFFFDKLQKSEIWMPNVDEQRIIGQQFDQLDSLITLHQRKLELLQNIKKSLLDKMFV
ncbi:restriction endonuclease subunit S [Bifidobacterium breve]|uniref:restriction endonuclease subunit S n=2 Tax=Bifidobacterium breve TaxID=1685 RepID=UPI000CA3182C|nr:restriction endonuclease S subunit [Bifidobacterium breve]